jgi:PAS domain S-box-containing protein
MSPIRNHDGKIIGVARISRDIASRKQAEEMQALLAAIVENATDAIVGRALDGAITSWNAAAERLYGYSAAEAVGSKLILAPPDLQHEVMANREQIVGGKTVLGYETAGFTKDGRRIEVSRSMSPIKDKNGNTIGMAAIVRDITRRKQAEAQLRLAASVFDNALDGIIITDEDFRIVAVNRAFTAITGYSAEEAIGNSPRMLRSGRQDEAFYETMRRALRETGNWQGEIWDKRKDGMDYCEHLSISAVHGERGEITNYCAVFADITPRKTAETKLLRLNAELEARVAQRTAALDHANKELEAFSYSVSHDLKAPLRHIAGFSGLLLNQNYEQLDSKGKDYLQRIVTSSTHMGKLIDDLLNLSRVTLQPLSARPVDLSAIAHQISSALAEASPQRHVEISIAPNLTACADPGLMRVVMDNLIGNAWKYSAKSAQACIEIGSMNRDGDTVFYVRDNGAGFSMEYAHKLFMPFQRLHHADQFEGTGIGLTTVKRIIERHQGKIWIESAVNTGTTAFFTIGKSD